MSRHVFIIMKYWAGVSLMENTFRVVICAVILKLLQYLINFILCSTAHV